MNTNIIKIAKNLMPALYASLIKLKRNYLLNKFSKNYPDTKIFHNETKEDIKLYSQDNQDYIVYENFFKNKKDGFFCDIGGNHPLKLNNTKYFEELGWHGIAFEPLPHMTKLWSEHRKAKLFPFALSDNEGEVIFTVVKDETGWEDMLSFVKETGEVEPGFQTYEIKVQTRIFKDIMKEENITHIDYLSLDVEGHELNVLKGIDFKKLKINVLTIENNPPSCVLCGDEKIRQLMFNNNYLLWGRTIGLDDIYVSKDFLVTINE
jgi:FkbM family methyltransferase